MTAEPNSSCSAVPPENVIENRRAFVGFGVASALFAVAAAFFFWCLPPMNDPLYALPQVLLLLALISPLLLWQSVVQRPLSVRISTISSLVIWLVGIGLAFAIKPSSPFIYTPDGLLLLGFVPLLYLWRFSIPWIVFGTFNLVIGVFLMMLSYIPDSYFPKDLWLPKHHLSDFHPCNTWILFGLVCVLYGLVRLSKNMFLLAARKKAPKSA